MKFDNIVKITLTEEEKKAIEKIDIEAIKTYIKITSEACEMISENTSCANCPFPYCPSSIIDDDFIGIFSDCVDKILEFPIED